MAKHIILEIRGLNNQIGKNPNQRQLDLIDKEEGRVTTKSVDNRKDSDISNPGLAMGSGEGTKMFSSYRSYRKIRGEYNQARQDLKDNLSKGLSAQSDPTLTDRERISMMSAEIQDFSDSYNVFQRKQEEMASLKPKAQAEIKQAIRSTTATVAAVAHYAKKVYDLHAQHQISTYTMSGLTTAAIKKKKQQEALGLVEQGIGIAVAFAINPYLGAAQLAMTALQRTIQYAEDVRRYAHEMAKDKYESNYYRTRLVRNSKVLI